MTVTTLVLVGVLLALIGLIPTGPYRRVWGYSPSGFIAAMAIVAMLLIAMGHV